jgi:hypothetical protein
LSYEGSDLETCNAVSHCLLLSYFPSPSILFIPVVKRRWVLRRELFRRFGTIFGFFATGMNRMDGEEKDKSRAWPRSIHPSNGSAGWGMLVRIVDPSTALQLGHTGRSRASACWNRPSHVSVVDNVAS